MGVTAGLYQPLFFGATQRAGVALSTLITVGSAPIFAGLISKIFIKEKLNALWLASTLIAIFGLTLRSINDISTVDTIGIFMAVGAGFAIGTYTSAAKVELRKGVNSIELPAISYVLGTIILSPFLVGQNFTWLFTKNGMVMALYLGLVTMALANVLYVLGLRELSAGPTATLLLADPLTATILGYFLLNESITTLGWIGIALVSAALILQSMARESSQPYWRKSECLQRKN
jgi:drug/metabolite transporter, DME family